MKMQMGFTAEVVDLTENPLTRCLFCVIDVVLYLRTSRTLSFNLRFGFGWDFCLFSIVDALITQ